MATRKLATRTLTGTSGKEYSFNVYPGDMRFNDFIPGVYYIFREDDDGEAAIYLGESDNVDVSLRNHDKQACFDENNFNRVAFHMNASKSVREDIASDLGGVLSPCCA